MRGEKLTRKWRLIKLSRMQRSDFAPKFIEEYLSSVDGIEETLYSYAVRYGVEKGEEVKRNITLKSFSDVAEFLGMISGIIVEKKNSVAVYSGCPSYMMTDVRKVEVCRGFIEGFFRAFNFLVEVRVKCGETCRIEVKLKD